MTNAIIVQLAIGRRRVGTHCPFGLNTLLSFLQAAPSFLIVTSEISKCHQKFGLLVPFHLRRPAALVLPPMQTHPVSSGRSNLGKRARESKTLNNWWFLQVVEKSPPWPYTDSTAWVCNLHRPRERTEQQRLVLTFTIIICSFTGQDTSYSLQNLRCPISKSKVIQGP